MSVLRNSKEASVEQSKQVVGMMEEVRGVGGGRVRQDWRSLSFDSEGGSEHRNDGISRRF